jgi:hypothetical protein
MLDMNKHIVKTDDSKPFHTSGYATVANRDRVGSVSTLSFERRQQIEQNRQRVGNYRQSVIGSSYSSLRPKTVAGADVTNRAAIMQSPRNSVPAPKPQSYNPYS